MQLLNLTIDRIIIHQVFRREGGNIITPMQGHEYTRFSKSAMSVFKDRVVDALGEKSKSVQMEVVKQDVNFLPHLVNEMAKQDDEAFAVSSYDIAVKLADAQQSRSIPGGIVIIFSGKQGLPEKQVIGIMKAEIHTGYEKDINKITKEISLKYVEELLLTPSAKLYKTAAFFENSSYDKGSANLNEKWTVMVSDSQISQTDGKAAAQYFYASFLGFGYPQSSARTTKQFYDSACGFIAKIDSSEEKRSDLLNALVTYLKVDTTPIISASDFSSKYFDIDTQDLFNEHMESAGLPLTGFAKDIKYIENKLKYRKVSFSCKVKVSAPSTVFDELISIKTIEGDKDESGTPAEWTQLIIKDRIIQQE